MAEQTTLPPAHEASAPGTGDINFLPPAELSKSVWQSLADNIRSVMHPEKLPPLQLTSKPIASDGLMLPDDSLWQSLSRNFRDRFAPGKAAAAAAHFEADRGQRFSAAAPMRSVRCSARCVKT